MNNATKMTNPITGEPLGEFPVHSNEDLKIMIEKARSVQPQWEKLPIRARREKISRMLKYIMDHADELAENISRPNGKTRMDALVTEILPSAIYIKYFCRKAKKFLKDTHIPSGIWLFLFKRSKIVRIPFGVIGIISPWNYPFSIPFYQVLMGLLAGNAIILKTATQTLQVGLSIRKVVESAGLPDGLFQLVNLPGKAAGDAFLDGGVDKLLFTGSVEVGKYLMRKAADTLTPVNLELGGNDAMLVCPDANLERAANGAVWAGLSNAGQSCGGVERIYVHEKVYDAFLEILKHKVENLKVGYDEDFVVDMGGMTTNGQVQTVIRHVEEAVSRGAGIYARSAIPSDDRFNNFYPATVLTNVNHDMMVMKDETFGPVLGVMRISDMEEGVRLANDSYLGLTGSVWSRDRKKAEAIGRKIKAGAITINDHLMTHGMPETPWGGFKQSGIGRSHGQLGFDEMTQPQLIVNDLLSMARKQIWWHPYNRALYKGIKNIMLLLFGRGVASRLKGLAGTLKIVPRMFRSE